LAAGLEAIDAGLELDGPAGFEGLCAALDLISPSRVKHWERQLIEQNARLVTVLDDEYPRSFGWCRPSTFPVRAGVPRTR